MNCLQCHENYHKARHRNPNQLGVEKNVKVSLQFRTAFVHIGGSSDLILVLVR